MKTNRCAIIAGSVIVGALLLKRFTTVLGAESFNAELPPVAYISQQAQQAAQPSFSPPAGPPSTPPNVPCDLSVVNARVTAVVQERHKVDYAEKEQENTLNNTLKTFKERKAKSKKDYGDSLKAAKAAVTKAKDDCAAAEKARVAAERAAKKAADEAAAKAKAAKIKAKKEAAAAKAKAEKEAKRKTGVATATTAIETASQQTGFLAAFTAWMASWGQDKTTATVVVDDNTTTQGFGDTGGKLEKIGGQSIQEGIKKNFPF
jgi:membrane protein involved in colicin uptake